MSTVLSGIWKSDAQKRVDMFQHMWDNSQTCNPSNGWNPGDRVYVLEGYHDPTDEMINEYSSELVAAEVINLNGGSYVEVRFDNGRTWSLENRGRMVRVGVVEQYLRTHTTALDLDTTHLDKLVLDPDAKAEIVSVLKQYKNMDKIFKEWGLDEVMEYGKAMSLLFYGKPGTGKTWGARCIANALGKELLVISAAEIQTSEPGGANRNIQAAFQQASTAGHVLLFDECDSLITDRSDVGMILASEINTLLTCLEQFDGVAIFATNRADTLDPAMERRISLMVEFPLPDAKQREDIWNVLLPKKMPLAEDVDVKKLAKFDLTGGYIKNVILNAARYAAAEEAEAVGKKHFGRAIKRVKDTQGLMGTHTSRGMHGRTRATARARKDD